MFKQVTWCGVLRGGILYRMFAGGCAVVVIQLFVQRTPDWKKNATSSTYDLHVVVVFFFFVND